MKYWNYPTVRWQWPLFVIGFVLFWSLTPLWLLYYMTRDPNVPFIMLNVQALFYNPWSP